MIFRRSRKHRGKQRSGTRYLPGDSFLHRLDPRTKLGLLVGTGILALASSTWMQMIVLLACITLLGAVSGLLRPFLRSMRLLLPLALFILCIDSLFPKFPQEYLYAAFSVGFLHIGIGPDGILFGLAMALRLCAIGGSALLFVMTTSFHEFIQALRAFRVPDTISFSLAFALRSTGTLAKDLAGIMNAQRSRAMEFDHGLLMKSRNAAMAVLIPMTVCVLNHAKHVSDAMLCRGFGRMRHTSPFKPLGFGRRDMAAAALLLLLSAGIMSMG